MSKKVFQQYLPDYIEKFKKDSRWKTAQSSRYIFHFFSGSVAEKEIEEIKARQEQAYSKIISFLGVTPPKEKITYYLYPNGKIKKALMGDSWNAQAILHDFAIHVLYTNKIKPIGEHEDTHLLSLSWGLAIGFLQEGLAEYLVGHNWYGQSHDVLAREALQRGIAPSFRLMLSHKNWTVLDEKNILHYYCFAASMTKFLMEKFGKNKFKRLYKSLCRENSLQTNIKIFREIYDVTPTQVENDWKRFLS